MKQRTIFLTLAGTLGFIIVLAWVARPGVPKDEPVVEGTSISAGTLEAKESAYDFGTISMKAGKVSHVFSVKNVGADPVTIAKMYTSCMCTTALLRVGEKQIGPYGMPGHGAIPRIDQAVNPGEEASVEVVFDPAAHGPAGVGKIQRVVTLEQNGAKPLEFNFSALVTP
ncbi:MAG: DUF1573 domain-containing protein [Patescibacteria group bacterium]